MSLQSRLSTFITAVGADVKAIYGRVLPSGGTSGQVLVKSSATDYAVAWGTASSGTTNYYQALNAPQAFAWASGSTFTLTSAASAIVSVSQNGQVLQPSEYLLTNSTTVTVTPTAGFVSGDAFVITTVQVGSFTGTSSQDLEIADSTKGLILRSPNGTRYRVTVANGGSLTTTQVT